MPPLVSIIIPLYNSEEHIEETIQSALSQTWKNIEIIIIDDGSTDQSLSIARRFECDKVKILSQENKGASAARNHGLSIAKGDFVQFLDADDILSINKVESQVKLLNGKRKRISFCRLFDLVNGKIIPKDNLDYSTFSSENPEGFLNHYLGLKDKTLHLGIHSWLIPLNLLNNAGLWNEKLSVDDDGEFTLRVILEAEEGIVFSPEGGCYYRKYPNSNSLSSQSDYKSIRSAIQSHELKFESIINKGLLSDLIIKRFADGYKWLAINSYGNYPDLYQFCIKKTAELGGSNYKSLPNSFVKRIIQKLFGWKSLKLLELKIQILKNRSNNLKQNVQEKSL